FAQFSRGNRGDAVLLNKLAKLVRCVDAPRLGASFYQPDFNVLRLAEEHRLTESFRKDHDKRQPQQSKQMPFVVFQCLGTRSRAQLSRFNRERVATFTVKL